MFRICSIGTGDWANFAHGPALQHYQAQHADVELAACCSLDLQQAQAYRDRFGYARCHTDFEQMLKHEQPHAVTVVLPVEGAADVAVRVMAAGYPVLMEKPPGANPAQTRRLIDAAALGGVANMVAFNRRYCPGIQHLKARLCKGDADAAIRHVSCDFYRFDRRDANFEMAAIHGIDATRHLVESDYKTVRFSYQSLPHMGPTVANVFMDCTFHSGATAQLRLCPTVGTSLERYTAHTDADTFFLDMPDPNGLARHGRLLHLHANQRALDLDGLEICPHPEFWMQAGFYQENALFFESLRHGTPIAGDIASGLQSVEIADCIGRRVSLFQA